ncbi:MAG: HAMP domain-containing protein [Lachnospiraceae bacterium]|nr:HAMP domain-containing protein [Lachnospiraceae bacterium]
MKQKNDATQFRNSIQRQFVVIFFLILAGAILFCVLMNETLLERYYIKNKKEVLIAAYHSINDAFAQGSSDTDDFQIEVQRISGIYNISMLIIDPDSEVLVSSENESRGLAFELQRYIFGSVLSEEEDENIKVLEEQIDYTIQNSYDKRTGISYLEMWGFLESGNPFLIRTALEGITESVRIANRFLIYAGLLAALGGIFAILVVTKQITRPIMQLARISRRMADLDFEAKYTGKEKNEIGILGHDMNRMSDKLEKTISELKTANNELQRDIEKKEQIDTMRSEFISNVSHELKTPLALIMGYAEGLKMDIGEDPESRDFYCEVIADEAEKMNTMVKELLTVSQLESGADLIQMERFNLVDLINNYLQSASILLSQCGAEVVFDPPDAIFVWGDEFKTEEVVMNYVTNAINHVSGENKMIRITVTQDGEVARTVVFNTGEHIPEENLPHIWEKFYKVDKARTREYGGSGIGLSIVKAIMEAMNRGYGARNVEGGVEFWFELETKA